jgi:hypothetical protein
MEAFADTQGRGVAGMQGRTQQTTNAFDPTQKSVAQQTFQSKLKDVFKFHRPPPKHLKYEKLSDRRKIHEYVYRGSPHVNLDSIEGFAAALIEKGEVTQAERFYGNRHASGSGLWCDIDAWKRRRDAKRLVPEKTPIVLGMDGSDVDDWTGIRAETADGFQFTPKYGPLGSQLPTIWNPADWDGQVPRLEVRDAMRFLFSYFVVVRLYIDPPYWTTECDEWAAEFGEKRVIRWHTARPVQMHAAAERQLTDITKKGSTWTHDGCKDTTDHVEATYKVAKPNKRYVLTKPDDGRKIDLSVASIICHEAAGDVTAAKEWPEPEEPSKMTVFRSRPRGGTGWR